MKGNGRDEGVFCEGHRKGRHWYLGTWTPASQAWTLTPERPEPRAAPPPPQRKRAGQTHFMSTSRPDGIAVSTHANNSYA